MRAWLGILVLFLPLEARGGKDLVEAGDKEIQINGEIKPDAPKIKVEFMGKAHLMPSALTEVKLKPGIRYRITMDTASSTLDPFLILKKEGQHLVQDDDSGGQLNSMLTFSPPGDEPATYQVFAAALQSKGGAFVLTITPRSRFALDPKVHEPGKKMLILKGELTEKNNEVHFRARLKKGKTYRIDMSSERVDSYLELLDPQGRELARDDDSGGKRDARITRAISEDGTYRIVAGSTNLVQTGPFVLEVREE